VPRLGEGLMRWIDGYFSVRSHASIVLRLF
jgi:hypothetical protein